MSWEAKEVPLFTLEDASGKAAGTQALWQRKDVVWASLHPPGCEACDALEERFVRTAQELTDQETAFLRSRSDGSGTPGTLVDVEDRVAAKLARTLGKDVEPRVVVANRYLEIYAALPVHGRPASAVLAEALEWLSLAQRQCAECAAPVDWAEER